MHQSHDARAALRQRLPEPRLERADHRAPNHPPLPSGSGSGSHAAAGQHLPAELILERAQAVDPTFQLTPITERFTLLTGGSHALSERQQTLRNTLAWRL